jgi:type II secretion system protein D
LFQLINSDADTMVKQLTDLFTGSGGAGGGGDGATQSQLVFGEAVGDVDLASVGQELRFAADPRTNTLLVAGAPVYLSMVEDLVRYLDSQEAEDRVTEVIPANYRDANDLANAIRGFVDQELNVLGAADDEESRLRRMERQISVEAIGDPEQGSSSLVLGTSRRAYQRTMEMVRALDRPEPQVMISVLIAEVTLTDNVELGIEIAGQDLLFSEKAVLGPNGIIQGSEFDFVGGSALGAAGSGLGFNFTVTGEDFGFLFHALESNDRLEVLSRPILMVRNGEEGKITIADQVPVVTATQISDTGGITPSFGREDVGIVLTTTPHISPDGYVTIALSQEISNIVGENTDLTAGVSQPTFSTREVVTNVTVRDGETVIIGGLIQTRDSNGVNKVPILGDLPWLGPLFRSTGITKSKTELVVVLTVDILRDDVDVKNMSVAQRDKYELPQSVLQNRLMEGLRITPDPALLGPVDHPSKGGPLNEPAPPPVDKEDPKRYGPKPKTYGPTVPQATPTSTASTSIDSTTPSTGGAATPPDPATVPVYGPRIARSDPAGGSP